MYIQYKTEVVGIIDSQPKQIKINYNDIRCIEFYFQEDLKIGNYLFITFKFSGKELTLESAQAITKPYLNSLIDLLIFKFNVPVSEPTIHAYKTIENHMVASGSITLFNHQEHELTTSDYTWLTSEIKSTTFSNKLCSNKYFQKYKSIILEKGVSSRFLLLYSLLYEIKGNQIAVDAYIKEKEPNIKTLPSTKSGSSDETVYTWWRNQSQHMQDDTSVKYMAEAYVNLIDKLQQLVFDAIKESLSPE